MLGAALLMLGREFFAITFATLGIALVRPFVISLVVSFSCARRRGLLLRQHRRRGQCRVGGGGSRRGGDSGDCQLVAVFFRDVLPVVSRCFLHGRDPGGEMSVAVTHVVLFQHLQLRREPLELFLQEKRHVLK